MFRKITILALLIIVSVTWHKAARSQELFNKKKPQTFLAATSELNLGVGQNKLSQNSYDHITLFTMLGGIKDKTAAFREVTCALKPKGVLSVSEVIFDDHFQTQDDVRKLAQQVGLEEVACYGRPHAYTLHFKKLDS